MASCYCIRHTPTAKCIFFLGFFLLTTNASSITELTRPNDGGPDSVLVFPLRATMMIAPDQSYPSDISIHDIIREDSLDAGERKITVLVDHLKELERLNAKYDIDILDEDDEQHHDYDFASGDEGSSSDHPSSAFSTVEGYNCLRNVEGIYQTVSSLVANDIHNLTTLTKIGESYLKAKTKDWGYDLNVLKITSPSSSTSANGDDDKKKKHPFFATFGIHAREIAPPEVGLRFAEKLVKGYGTDADVTQILDTTEVHLLLLANPDARFVVDEQPKIRMRRRKNMNFEDQSFSEEMCEGGKGGVDLNRNFPWKFGADEKGSSSDPCSEAYRGAHAISEPEVKAIMEYSSQIFPKEQQRRRLTEDDEISMMPLPSSTRGMFMDMHSYGKRIIGPWGYKNEESPNQNELLAVMNKLSRANQYKPTLPNVNFWYTANGNTIDWVYGALGVPPFCVEMGNAFFPTCSEFENEIMPDNLPILMKAVKLTAAPFRLGQGPDVKSVAVSGERTTVTAEDGEGNSKDKIALTATVSGFETRQGQNVKSVNYYVSDYPSIGTGRKEQENGIMTKEVPSGSAVLEFALDTTVGKKMLTVQAVDSDGNEGPFSSVFFNVDVEAV